jgi:(2Fe-2S) ferredoxin
MAPFERHIFVCCNQREPGHPRGCCDPHATDWLQKAFKKALAARGLNRTVRANRSGCLDQCEHGPTVVVYPEAVWYGGVAESDVDEIIESHIVGGRPVERLRLPDQCVNTGTCPHKPRAPALQAGKPPEAL